MISEDILRSRAEALAGVVDALFSKDGSGRPSEATVEAVAGDHPQGWPRPMVELGFRLHRETWDVEGLLEAAGRELSALPERARVRVPSSIAHIWPHLPGAGVTPVLFGALLGVEQRIRPPSGAAGFARHLVEVWRGAADEAESALPALELVEPEDEEAEADWLSAGVVVVSGSDETLAGVRRRRLERAESEESAGQTPGRPGVIGYGHRVSFGVVPAGVQASDFARVAERMARDVVMWHQSGCFSLRGVLVEETEAGSRERAEAFAERLGSGIAAWEGKLEAVPTDEARVSDRATGRGLAEFRGARFGPKDGFGWAEVREEPFAGERAGTHVATVHPIEASAQRGPETLGEALALPGAHLQGVALPEQVDPAVRRRWIEALAAAGVTRICAPGRLQAPPAGWWHDGRPNLQEWLRVTCLE